MLAYQGLPIADDQINQSGHFWTTRLWFSWRRRSRSKWINVYFLHSKNESEIDLIVRNISNIPLFEAWHRDASQLNDTFMSLWPYALHAHFPDCVMSQISDVSITGFDLSISMNHLIGFIPFFCNEKFRLQVASETGKINSQVNPLYQHSLCSFCLVLGTLKNGVTTDISGIRLYAQTYVDSTI